MSDPYVSLASSTSTAIESASKHNIQCRVSTDHIMQWTQSSATTGDTAATIIRDNKMNYCMNKNDIVVGLRRGWFPQSCMQMRAYPLVVTTYADMCLAAQYWLMRLYNNAKNTTDIRLLVNEPLTHSATNGSTNPNRDCALKPHEREQIEMMPQFYFQGVSLGVAYAHSDSGDTVGTVMYGGLRTVLNGHFKANTGQLCMWYFEFEAKLFDPEGRRIWQNGDLPPVIEAGYERISGRIHAGSLSADNALDATTLDRRKWHDRENGNYPGTSGKRNVFYLKPYVRNDEGGENIMDRERVCGVYISSAREFEQVDLKLQRQAL